MTEKDFDGIRPPGWNDTKQRSLTPDMSEPEGQCHRNWEHNLLRRGVLQAPCSAPQVSDPDHPQDPASPSTSRWFPSTMNFSTNSSSSPCRRSMRVIESTMTRADAVVRGCQSWAMPRTLRFDAGPTGGGTALFSSVLWAGLRASWMDSRLVCRRSPWRSSQPHLTPRGDHE